MGDKKVNIEIVGGVPQLNIDGVKVHVFDSEGGEPSSDVWSVILSDIRHAISKVGDGHFDLSKYVFELYLQSNDFYETVEVDSDPKFDAYLLLGGFKIPNGTQLKNGDIVTGYVAFAKFPINNGHMSLSPVKDLMEFEVEWRVDKQATLDAIDANSNIVVTFN